MLASTVGTSANVTSVTAEAIQSAGPGQGILQPLAGCSGANGQLYATLQQEDPVAWGAAWMFYATGNSAYLNDYSNFYTSYESTGTVRKLLSRSCALIISACRYLLHAIHEAHCANAQLPACHWQNSAAHPARARQALLSQVLHGAQGLRLLRRAWEIMRSLLCLTPPTTFLPAKCCWLRP